MNDEKAELAAAGPLAGAAPAKYDELFPAGRCECDGPTCCHGRGPAAFEVTRDGKRMKVCTRCDLTSDGDKKLLVTRDMPAKLFFDFDPLGALCIAFNEIKKDEAAERATLSDDVPAPKDS